MKNYFKVAANALPKTPIIRDFSKENQNTSNYINANSTAKDTVENLRVKINEYNNICSENEEVGIILTNYGQNTTISIQSVEWSGFNLVIFNGFIGNDKVSLIQHLNQINLLLTKLIVPKERKKISLIEE